MSRRMHPGRYRHSDRASDVPQHGEAIRGEFPARAGPLALGTDRLAELDRVARERHYFAAHFVDEIWRKAENGPVKVAAAKQLVSLLEYGTAYESLPELY